MSIKNLITQFSLIVVVISACTKKDDLEDLEYNRWEEQVPNVLQIDSVRVRAVDTTLAEVLVYYNFDRPAFESEWDRVSDIRFDFYSSATADTSLLDVDVFLDDSGRGRAVPDQVSTNARYVMRYRMELENGRSSVWSRNFTIDTPSF